MSAGSRYVTVEISLETIDTDDLIDELEERGYEVTEDGHAADAEAAYFAMHRGDLETVRAFILEAAGRVA